MERFVVAGGARLAGEVTVTGAKNSVLKLMAASLLAVGRTHLTAVPDILDVAIMSEVLRRLGCDVQRGPGSVTIDVPEQLGHEADYDLVRRMRASIAVFGPLIARCGEAKVALPGGDAIGSRGLDFHIAGLVKLGAHIDSEHGYLIAKAPRLSGAQVWLDFPSVGALPDRIVAGTWAMAAALTRGDVFVRGGRADHLEVPLDKLAAAGARVESGPDGFRVRMDDRPRAVDVVTLPYPGFPTDLQPMVLALNSVADGTAMVTENVFEARWMFVNELTRLGADVRTDGHHAVVRGKERLSGAPVKAHDIRAGAALVLAGLVADGVTEVGDVHHVDRGYEGFVEQLCLLGAEVRREAAEEELPF
ncbi:MAG: UDP-N-acetylglucosamine 1-carboxyvinyltransferase [Actinobacteria bacterium]|nr:UDP-N-acetylglucosamine 1-carboxyvinyltransferase [Actinomycetota bacterium]